YTTLIVLLPFLSMAIVWKYFRKNSLSAVKFFYGVELPLMLLLLLRVVLFRDVPLAAQFIFLNIAIGIAAYFRILILSSKPTTTVIDQAFSTLIAFVGIYLGVLLGIYFLPIALSVTIDLWDSLGKTNWQKFLEAVTELVTKPMLTLVMFFFALTFFFFLITPLVLIITYVRQFVTQCRNTRLPQIITVLLAVGIIEVGVLTLRYEQPQVQAFELTEELSIDPLMQQQSLANEDTVREGLLNGYLGAYRYLSTTDGSRSLKKRYSDIFGEPSSIADNVQTLFNWLASPFLYQGKDFEKDRKLAADRYQQFFDTPIEKGERESILAAVKATWENEQNEAGLMNAASHHVLLKDQTITVKEYGDVAAVTINQVLENQTYQPQEAVFHFSLPQDAAVTGLWMSDDIVNPEKFPHVVSPRGAAQSVYKSEVRRRIDPALLEKVGPQQYRLRAFPIPARQIKNNDQSNRYRKAIRDFTVKAASVQLEYTVSIDSSGHWPMPTLLEKRNVYWTDQTIRSHHTSLPSNWLPNQLTASNPKAAQPHTSIVNGGTIRAIPRDNRKPENALEEKIAIIIDGSFSMNQVKYRLNEELEWLAKNVENYDLFFCQEACEQTDLATLMKQVYFGNSQLIQQLSQWKVIKSKHYSSVFLLSDAGSYELSQDKDLKLQQFEQPLWFVHLSDLLPYAYADSVIDTVNDSRGGIATSLESGIEQFLWTQEADRIHSVGKLIDVSTEYFWYWSEGTSSEQKTTPFTTLAADHLINHLARTHDKTQLKNLDMIHNIAKTHNLTTFYSSMLVLVEDRQRELLKKAESQDDRFEREIETGEETLGKPIDPFAVPSVPEPEEWALLIVAACLLLTSYIRRRNRPSGL
ncbi:MAG: TIGR02921 family PEP-CTERM protein, partial [Pseudomonadales bacterium]|nr:TIGR02921 family PEP-CTERM protein [Pseudomonadales bacterium]